MVSGAFRLEGPDGPIVEVRRTMGVIGSDDEPMGQVAGVLFDPVSQGVSAVVLGNYTDRPEYRLIDVGLIAQVVDRVRLRIPGASRQTLPLYGRV